MTKHILVPLHATVLGILMLITLNLSRGDTIVFSNGRTVEGEISADKGEVVVIKTSSGTITVSKDRIMEVRETVATQEKDLDALYETAEKYETLGRYDKSYETYLELLTFDRPDTEELHHKVIRVEKAFIEEQMPAFGIEGDNLTNFIGWDESKQKLAKAPYHPQLKRAVLNHISSLHCRKALGSLDAMKITSAKQLLSELIEAHPSYSEPYGILTTIYLKQGMTEQAVEYCRLMVVNCPEDIYMTLVAADLLYENNSPDEALEIYAEAVPPEKFNVEREDYDKFDIAGQFQQASLRTETHGLYEEALAYLKAYINIMNQESMEDLQRLVKLYEAVGDTENASQAAQRLEEIKELHAKIDKAEARAAVGRGMQAQMTPKVQAQKKSAKQLEKERKKKMREERRKDRAKKKK